MREIKSNNYEHLKINARVQDFVGGGGEGRGTKDDVQLQS